MVTTLTRTISTIVAILVFVVSWMATPSLAIAEQVTDEMAIVGVTAVVGSDSERFATEPPVESGLINAPSISPQNGSVMANDWKTHQQPLTYTINESPVVSSSADKSFDPCSLNTCPTGAPADIDSRHRFWVVSSRGLTWNTCAANLDSPSMNVSQLYCNGVTKRSSMDEFQAELQPGRRVVYYVHGNRTSSVNAIQYGLTFFNRVKSKLDSQPTDWVIFNWPSAQAGMLLKDAREKAARTDAQGLYLAWLLRHHVQQSSPIAMIGYSFGARVISGSIHALAGGPLANRSLPEPHYRGADLSVGFVAAAFDGDWLREGHYHGCTTKNMRTLTMFYNQRDVALRNHWRLTRERSSEALGFSGPRCLGPRNDGTKLPVRALNCTASVRARHAERFYYDRACSAGLQMATLINQATPASNLQITIQTDGISGQF